MSASRKHTVHRIAFPEGAAARLLKGSIACGLISIAVSLILSFVCQWPMPRIHDEFSYLLAADTFSHGRLANPPHPMWQYFETEHVLQQPAYASKYPPGQGLILALGEVLGDPVIGAWIGAALAAMSVYFLCRARFSPGWSLLGGMLCAFHPLMLLWSQNFWGGALQTTGGALLAGAALRATHRPNWLHGCLAGLGASILALTRPYEGALFALLCAGLLGFALFRKRTAFPSIAVLAAGAVPILLATACFLGFYNKCVTGHIMTMPFVVYERAYSAHPLFLWQAPVSLPNHRHEAMRQLALWEQAPFEPQKHISGFFFYLLFNKLIPLLYPLTWYWLLLLPLGFAAVKLWNRFEIKTGFVLLAGFFIGEMPAIWWQPHYFGAILGIVIAMAVGGLQRMQHISPVARRLTWLLVCLLLAISLSFQIIATAGGDKKRDWATDRQELIAKLTKLPGQHLVVVAYEPGYSPHCEWVYNGADINGSKVIFARKMADNSALLSYFKDRSVWNLWVGSTNYRLVRSR